ncbi:hypothetical protein QAD02_014416 [Eretmocerus hayati]|uniref:Uncharacterized protein n=1 Tax=Eretmocerus hayati TaxID=131215 RepID=A0ACC2P5T9_9HYME|nr:hypothetical protein QAD02_014416 [Eretmocerus hayati]
MDELKKRRQEEYQMQLFGLHSRTVLAYFDQKVLENVDFQCKQMYESMIKKYNPDAEGTDKLKKEITKLRKAYRRNMQPHMLVVKKNVEKFINVPKNVLLEEDKCQAKQFSDEEFTKLDKMLQSLQQRAKRVSVLNAAMKEELDTIEKLEPPRELAKKLCSIVDKGLMAQNFNNRTLQAVKECKELVSSLDSLDPQLQKERFNPKLDENDLNQILID